MIEISDHSYKATALGLDNEKNLFVRSVRQDDARSMPLAQFLSSLPLSSKRVLLFGITPSLAASFSTSVVLSREHVKDPLSEKEFRDLLSRAASLALNRYEPQAAERLSSGGESPHFVQMRMRAVRADGREVLHPAGLSSRQLEFDFELCFLTRSLADTIARALPEGVEPSLYTEPGAAFARLLLATSSGPLALAYVGADSTTLYRAFLSPRYIGAVSLPRIEYVGSVPWGNAYSERALSDSFSIDSSVARGLLARIAAQDLSPLAHRGLQKMFSEHALPSLSSMHALLKGKEPYYWTAADSALPDFSSSQERIAFRAASLPAILTRLGFTAHAPRYLSTTWHSAISLFLDYYYGKEGASSGAHSLLR